MIYILQVQLPRRGGVKTTRRKIMAQQQPAHETIHIPRIIGSRKYLACGFLKDGEPSVPGQTMLDRTKVEGTRAIDDEDMENLSENREDFSPELDPYYIATHRHNPDLPQFISCFGKDDEGWQVYLSPVRSSCGCNVLVLRRCL